MTHSVIIKTDPRGVLSIAGDNTSMQRAEAEASRMRLRDDTRASYCTYTGIFTLKQAEVFVRCRNAGMSIEHATREAKPHTRRSL